MINYAHRGASEYAPENTLSSFYMGLLMGANGIETDVQRTKDGELVLFHDDTVDRVSDSSGKVSELTLSELKALKITGNCTTGFYDRVVTFSEFLDHFAAYDISFAIELKGPGVEEDSLALCKKYGILGNTTFTSFNFSYIKKIRELDRAARIGFLTSRTDDEVITELKAISCEEIAPKASEITPELMKKWRENGLGVRAWGVGSVETMKKMCELGVDGMTVNFPDRLTAYLGTR